MLASIEVTEKRPILMTSPTYQAIITDRNADPEDPPEVEYGAEEEEDDEDYGEEGEEAEYGDYGDYGEEDAFVEKDEWPPKDKIGHIALEDRFFVGAKEQKMLRKSYSEVEIGAFMKVLNVKPYRQWEDETTHHYKLGVHDYEDDS